MSDTQVTTPAPTAPAETKRKRGTKAEVGRADNGVLTWKFAHGESRDVDPKDSRFDAVRDAIQSYGFVQKLTDVYSNAADSREAIEMFDSLLAKLQAGEFSLRKAGEVREEPLEILVEALGRFAIATGKTFDQSSRERLTTMLAGDKDKRAALRRDPRVAVHIAQVKAERAPATSGGVLDEILA